MFAYGLELHLDDPDRSEEPPVTAPAQWRVTRVVHERGAPPTDTAVRVSTTGVAVDAAGSLGVRLTAGDVVDTATVVSPRLLEPAAIAHPVAALVGAASAAHHDRVALHGLGVVLHDRAWVLLAQQEGGKSSLAAWLDRAGVPVLADDLVVLDGEQVLAGPRSCDLRRTTALEAGLDEDRMTPVSWRERWRLTLGPAPWSAPLAGFVDLAWSDSLSVTRPSVASRLVALGEADALSLGPPTSAGFLDLAARSWLRVERPRSFDAMDDVVSALQDATGSHGVC